MYYDEMMNKSRAECGECSEKGLEDPGLNIGRRGSKEHLRNKNYVALSSLFKV